MRPIRLRKAAGHLRYRGRKVVRAVLLSSTTTPTPRRRWRNCCGETDTRSTPFHDGHSALESALRIAPDVVLLDLGMPKMDGLEVARRLRQMPAMAAALLVAVTGWGQEADRQRTREAGFDHHLVKPVDADGLRQLLAQSEPAGNGRH